MIIDFELFDGSNLNVIMSRNHGCSWGDPRDSHVLMLTCDRCLNLLFGCHVIIHDESSFFIRLKVLTSTISSHVITTANLNNDRHFSSMLLLSYNCWHKQILVRHLIKQILVRYFINHDDNWLWTCLMILATLKIRLVSTTANVINNPRFSLIMLLLCNRWVDT